MPTLMELFLIWGIALSLVGIWVWAVVDLSRALVRWPAGSMRVRLGLALVFVVLTGPVSAANP